MKSSADSDAAPCGTLKLRKRVRSTCRTPKRQDESSSAVIAEKSQRDEYRRRVSWMNDGQARKAVFHCSRSETGNRDPARVLTLLLARHVGATRTFYVQDDWLAVLRILWREQQPDGHEQGTLDVAVKIPLPGCTLLWSCCSISPFKITRV